MNVKRLLRLEKEFLEKYPYGFDSYEMQRIKKKHNLEKLVNYIHDVCSIENLKRGIEVFPDVAKVVGKSSMVSVFEKMRFRDTCADFDKVEKLEFLHSIYELIHGDKRTGFDGLLNLLSPYKLAKWPLITVWRAYFYPENDVFIKPTTVKKVISYIELEDIVYTPAVNYEFYRKYKGYINEMKKVIKTESLKPNNPAFSGFLMMTII